MCSTIPPLRAYHPPFDSNPALSRSTSVSDSMVMTPSRKNISGMERSTRSKNTATRPQPTRTHEKQTREIPVVSSDEKDNQDDPTGRRAPITTSKTKVPVEVPANEYNAQRLEASTEPHKVQQNVEIRHEPAYPSPGDPITSRRTLEFVEDLLTPLQSIPMETVYEKSAKTWDHRAIQQQPDESSLTTSPGLQDVFDEWLAPMGDENASEAMSGHSGKNWSRDSVEEGRRTDIDFL